MKAERRQYVKNGEISAVLREYLKLGQKMHSRIGSMERVGDQERSQRSGRDAKQNWKGEKTMGGEKVKQLIF